MTATRTFQLASAGRVVPADEMVREVSCKLCGGIVEVLNTFKAKAIDCPHCNLQFSFDPMRQPLPVRGVKLRYADVVGAQKPATRMSSFRASSGSSAAVTLPQADPEVKTMKSITWTAWAVAAGVVIKLIWDSLFGK